ncbi:hypothetical protein FJ881_23850 [Escherichia albertii]|uniref:Uncharacterized protein n=2 Tax=Escherichia albertii TaxID=208962 RepID=A0ABX5HE79_ESCAL|nr:hypothetical protein [Escherichia albertii]CTV25294.1 Uncharacterised protein [Escherichia coli]EFB1502896.1 hypothetical protein [Escherichia albertii]EFF0783927.1 hypothetical protein [Escherichia albertii]EFF0797321.1 hypothetical protein [Escherichia albertii]EHG7530445.1 hypothetical protein [Escherichia albertii]
MIPDSISNKGYVCVDISCSPDDEHTTILATNRRIKVVEPENKNLIARNHSVLTLNDFLDKSSDISSPVHVRDFGSQLTLNDFLDSTKTNDVSGKCNSDVVIDIEPFQSPTISAQERGLLLSRESNSVCIEIDERITKILECEHKYQLDSIIGDIIPKEHESIETVRHLIGVLNEQYHNVYNKSGCFYKAYMALHNQIEKILPYAFRAGGGISIHLLIQALFFNGKYNKPHLQHQDLSLYTSIPPTIKTEAFLNNVLSLDISQVRMIGDLLAATLFHTPTIFYQYPKLIDEIKQCLEKRTITGSVIARFTLCLTSSLMTISPLIMLGGAIKVGNIVRTIGRGVSYCDIPLALAILGDSWYKAYKYGSSDNPNSAQRFISQESAFKTTQRVFSQGLSLMSSLSGAILRHLEKGTPPQMMSLFIVNILNLFFHQNPYEGTSASVQALKRQTYSHNPDTLNIQTIALCVDLQSINKITAPLFNTKDRLTYAFNGPRTNMEGQKHILKEIITACSHGERAILSKSQAAICRHEIDNIYDKKSSESDLSSLPKEMACFLKYLNEVHEKDTSCLSLGNGVNEQIIAVIVKVLAFREAVLC